jgi:hypothetical protein
MSEVQEEMAEAIEETAEVVADAVRSLTGLKIRWGLFGYAIGLVSGGVISYAVNKKYLETKYQDVAMSEIDKMRQYFHEKEQARAEQNKPDLADVVEQLGYATRYATKQPSDVREGILEPEAQLDVRTVFTEENYRGLSVDNWDYDHELRNRTPDRPYVIHKEEFMEEANPAGVEYESVTLTYFLEDDVLADEADRRVEDIDEKVGLENLEKFGHGSEDANVVYVRNDRLQVEFEILRSGGSYTAEVLGQDPDPDEEELRHSATMRRRSPRVDDD